MDGNEVILTKNGKEAACMISCEGVVSNLTDSLTGILKNNTDLRDEREKKLRKKYEGFQPERNNSLYAN